MVGGLGSTAIQQNNLSNSERPASWIFTIFLRLLSLVVLAVSLFIWSNIVGFGGPDLMEISQGDNFTNLLYVTLAVVTPVLGVGLWLGLSWGLILWGLVGGGLVATHFIIKPLGIIFYTFGASLTILLILYCIGLFIRYILTRKPKTKSDL